MKDIVLAEINRRYQAQQAALRPKSADHVPFGWSPKTSEGKLLQRHKQAASLAREKASLLREALGYDVPVAMPIYGMATSEQLEQRMEQLLGLSVWQAWKDGRNLQVDLNP